MVTLDGKLVSAKIRKEIMVLSQAFTQTQGRPPGLGVILVGEDPASQVYVGSKLKACVEVGFYSLAERLPANASLAQIKTCVAAFNANPLIDGILVQLPLPAAIAAAEVIQEISPEKDADALTFVSGGRLINQTAKVRPCTPAGVIEILKHYKVPLVGQDVVVVGRSQIVGRPMGLLLLEEDATVTYCHSKSLHLKEHLLRADVVVVAAGRPQFFGREDFKKGATIVDVGIHRRAEGLCGDVRFAELVGHAYAATPVPGGVGPMTIAMLLKNTLTLAQARATQRVN